MKLDRNVDRFNDAYFFPPQGVVRRLAENIWNAGWDGGSSLIEVSDVFTPTPLDEKHFQTPNEYCRVNSRISMWEENSWHHVFFQSAVWRQWQRDVQCHSLHESCWWLQTQSQGEQVRAFLSDWHHQLKLNVRDLQWTSEPDSCRELCFPRFMVRDFQYNEEEMKADQEEMNRLSTDKKKQFVRKQDTFDISYLFSSLFCSPEIWACCLKRNRALSI